MRHIWKLSGHGVGFLPILCLAIIFFIVRFLINDGWSDLDYKENGHTIKVIIVIALFISVIIVGYYTYIGVL